MKIFNRLGGDKLENLYEKDILRSKEEKRVLTSNIYGIEDEYYKLKNEYIPCVVIWYGEIKVLIPITHLGLKKESKASLRGLIGAEIDFIVMEYDEISNIAIGSRSDAMKIRRELEIPKLKELSLPDILGTLIEQHNGIILVTGPTGCGKSTTIASLINYINETKARHVITIEDPVEYVFECKNSIISQRQIGVDTKTFADGIKYALRQDPDVIFIGEIRDKETMTAALKAAETGHLVLSTLHTNDAVQTINRVVNMFDEANRYLIRKQLSETLRATIAQKLVYSEKMQKRFPACEIMVVTSTVKDYLVKDNLDEIYELLKDNNLDDMVSMNSSLASLVSSECITKEEAIQTSNDVPELEKIFRGVYLGTKAYYE